MILTVIHIIQASLHTVNTEEKSFDKYCGNINIKNK